MSVAATTVSFEPSAFVPFALSSFGLGLWERLLGLAHTATGPWLMCLTVSAVLNMARGFDLPL